MTKARDAFREVSPLFFGAVLLAVLCVSLALCAIGAFFLLSAAGWLISSDLRPCVPLLASIWALVILGIVATAIMRRRSQSSSQPGQGAQ